MAASVSDNAALRAEALRLRAGFEAMGAEPFDAPVLIPAGTLLDLYGEDIRGRAYVTSDPLRGEHMLRPDFTVPVVQAHMARDEAAGRYAYAGVVFRQQDQDPDRPIETFQAGLEVFGGEPAHADAEVFAALAAALDGLPVRAVTGDIGVLAAAVESLEASAPRKAALRRHLWRPARFRGLLERFAGRAPLPADRAELLALHAAGDDALAEAGPAVGQRTAAEVRARLDRLVADQAEPPIPAAQVSAIDRLVRLAGPAPQMPDAIAAFAPDLPGLCAAAERLEARWTALEAQGVAVDSLQFETSFGRTTLEYYDGFVFGFLAAALGDTPPVAQGGRYDALTRVLGGGRAAPAVGGVVRPDRVLALREGGRC